MNDADSGVEAAGQTLPFQGVVKKTIAVIERGVDGMCRLPVFALKRSEASAAKYRGQKNRE
jgi:hypothetical protein